MQMFTHVKIVTGFMDKNLGQENNKIWAVKGGWGVQAYF